MTAAKKTAKKSAAKRKPAKRKSTKRRSASSPTKPSARKPSAKKPKKPTKPRALALLSGGLDSSLAIRLLLDQGFPVTALHFTSVFSSDAD